MSDERSEEQVPSVFGNLPASRPGMRSPRRVSEGKPDGGPEAEARSDVGSDPPAEAETAIEPEPHRAEAADPARPDEPPADGPGGLEDLAWGGIAVAAEAATLGVRLATRAAEALRDAASRR